MTNILELLTKIDDSNDGIFYCIASTNDFPSVFKSKGTTWKE